MAFPLKSKAVSVARVSLSSYGKNVILLEAQRKVCSFLRLPEPLNTDSNLLLLMSSSVKFNSRPKLWGGCTRRLWLTRNTFKYPKFPISVGNSTILLWLRSSSSRKMRFPKTDDTTSIAFHDKSSA